MSHAQQELPEAADSPGAGRPDKLSVDYFVVDNDAGFVDRGRGRRFAAPFLLLWLAGWTVGCVFIAREAIIKGQIQLWLFGIPFWSSWLFVAGLVLYMLFGRIEFALTSRGVFYVRRLFVPISQRFIPLEEVKRFRRYTESSDQKSGSSRQYGIEMATFGKPLRMGTSMTAVERDWLCGELNRHLELLRESTGIESPKSNISEHDEVRTYASASSSRKALEILRLADEPVAPPSDCQWEARSDFALEFSQRGKFQLAGIAGTLFICLFWNGIVSIFLYALIFEGGPDGLGGIGLFLFLIPFELIGLLLLAAVALTIFDPFRRSVWRITEDTIEYDLRYLGLGYVWRYPVGSCERLELRRGKKGKDQNMSMLNPDGNAFSLSFVGNQNQQLAQMAGFTEGEARWIGDYILRERPLWFR